MIPLANAIWRIPEGPSGEPVLLGESNMERCVERRIACYTVAVLFSPLSPFVAQSEEVRFFRPQVAPAIGSAAPTEAAGSTGGTVVSTCPPDYCGNPGQSVYKHLAVSVLWN